MGTRRGLYYICDRCGKSMFKEEAGIGSVGKAHYYHIDSELEEDELYEGAKDWDYIYPDRKVMHGKLLCPECGQVFDLLMENFMKGT